MYQKCQLESFIFSFSISGNSDVQKRSNTVLMCSCVIRSTGEPWSQPDFGTRSERNPKRKLIIVIFFLKSCSAVVRSNSSGCGAEMLDFFIFWKPEIQQVILELNLKLRA